MSEDSIQQSVISRVKEQEDKEDIPSQPGLISRLILDTRNAFQTRRTAKELLFKITLAVFIVIIISPFFLILFHVLSVGLPEIMSVEFFTTEPGPGLQGGILNAIVGTLELMGIAGMTGIPISVFGAVYINEYAKPGKLRGVIEFAADVMAGIPSIVYGAFGLIVFVNALGFGKSLLAGGLTLGFMMIPTVLRTTQEALRAVPMALREASLALGATKWTTTWSVTIRAAFPGVVTGILLAIGRIIGETAPLLLTAGFNIFTPISFFDQVASMPYVIYFYLAQPANTNLPVKAHATALALMIIVLAVDIVANYISRKVTRRLV
jgi:phosphate transport system permease protein